MSQLNSPGSLQTACQRCAGLAIAAAVLLFGIPCSADPRPFITEKQAIDAVKKLFVVQEFAAHAKGEVKFIATPPQPAGVALWDVEVGQTEGGGDHLSVFEHFSVDARTGQVPGAEIAVDPSSVGPVPSTTPSVTDSSASAASAASTAPSPISSATPPPPGSTGSETRTGPWHVFPGRSATVASPDGHWQCRIEGWTTRGNSSDPVTALTTDAEVSHLLYRARLIVTPAGGGTARSLVTVGPQSADDPDLYHDLHIVAWSPDSQIVQCAYDQGAPMSEVGATHLLLARLNRSVRIVRSEHLRRICETAGLALDPVWSWRLDLRGFTTDGRVLLAFDESGDEGAAKRTGPRVFSLDPASLAPRAEPPAAPLATR